MRSFFTFGYGGVNEEEQEKFERKMDEHRKRALAEQEDDQAKRNAYPGLEERQRRKAEQEAREAKEKMDA